MNINQSEILSSILKRIRICSNFGNALSEIDAVEKLLDDNKVSKEELLEFLLNVKNIWPKSNEVLKACNNIQKKIIEISKKSNHESSLHSSINEPLTIHYRTTPQIYAGKKSCNIPTLKDACVKIIVNNLDQHYDFSSLKLELVMKILYRCDANQIELIEKDNAYLKNHTDEIWKNQCMGIAQISNLPADCENWYKAYKQLKLKKRPNINNIRNKIVKKNEKIVQSKTKNVSISAGNPKKNIKFNYLSNKNNTSLSKTKPQLSTGMKKTIQMFKTEIMKKKR